MTKKQLSITLGTVGLFLAEANPAQAVQAHGGIEGLIAHQIGHFLFTVGMSYLLFRLHLMPLKKSGWLQFKLFLTLLIAWNILTFSGHWLDTHMARDSFIRTDGHTLSFIIKTPLDLIYYLTRLDHLILVPAFIFLVLALKRWGHVE